MKQLYYGANFLIAKSAFADLATASNISFKIEDDFTLALNTINQSDMFTSYNSMTLYVDKNHSFPVDFNHTEMDILIYLGVKPSKATLESLVEFEIINTEDKKVINDFLQQFLTQTNLSLALKTTIKQIASKDFAAAMNLAYIANTNKDIKTPQDLLEYHSEPNIQAFKLINELKTKTLNNLPKLIKQQEIPIFLWCLAKELDKMSAQINTGKFFQQLLEIDILYKSSADWLPPLIIFCKNFSLCAQKFKK